MDDFSSSSQNLNGPASTEMEGRVLLGYALWKGVVMGLNRRRGERKGEWAAVRRAAVLAGVGAGRAVAEKRSVWARRGEREHEEEAPSSACGGLKSGSVVNKIDFD